LVGSRRRVCGAWLLCACARARVRSFCFERCQCHGGRVGTGESQGSRVVGQVGVEGTATCDPIGAVSGSALWDRAVGDDKEHDAEDVALSFVAVRRKRVCVARLLALSGARRRVGDPQGQCDPWSPSRTSEASRELKSQRTMQQETIPRQFQFTSSTELFF
jgi:hypothetical protein